jgi:hypothetical protein
MWIAIGSLLACSLCLAVGFCLGLCLRDLNEIAAVQECNSLMRENEQLQESLADAKRLIEEGERAMVLLDEYRAKVADAYAIEREDFKSYNLVG